MDIIELGLSYFKNDVPTAKVFADEVWRPNYVNFNSNEKKVIDFMSDYASCYHKIGTAYMDGTIFKRDYANILKNADEVNALLGHKISIELLKNRYEKGIIELKAHNDKKTAIRKDFIELKLSSAKDDISNFNKRREEITALINALEKDMKELNNSLEDDQISISTGNDLYSNGGDLVVTDLKPNSKWQKSHYTYSTDSKKLTKIDDPFDDVCDCCDCK